MLFHTWVFAAFFLVFYPVYLAVKGTRLRDYWLLLSSYVFYGWWNPLYLLLISYSTVVDYFVVLRMVKSPHRKRWLALAVTNNLCLLATFKYAGFLTENLNALLAALGIPHVIPVPNWLLPVGISFYTFQSMSYTIDCYRGRIQPEPRFVRFATFVSLVPATGGRADPARVEPAAAVAAGAEGHAGGRDGRAVALPGGLVQEGGAGGLPGALRGQGLRRAGTVPGAGAAAGDGGVRVADLLRLQRLYGHGPRHRADDGLQADAELQPSVPGARGLGISGRGGTSACRAGSRTTCTSRWAGTVKERWKTYRNMCLTMLISGVWHGATWMFVIWGALHALGRVLTRELEEDGVLDGARAEVRQADAGVRLRHLRMDLLPGALDGGREG